MNKAKNILVFIDWYLPGYRAGGPIQSVANMVARLPFQFWIVTSAFDHGATEAYQGVEQNVWITRRPNEHVLYLPREGMNKKHLRTWFDEREYDAIYLNSLFSKQFALTPLFFIRSQGFTHKTIIAPRGMLKAGALSLKGTKKKWFLRASRFIGLFNGLRWAASSETEADEVRMNFGTSCQVHVAPNLPRKQEVRQHIPEKKPGELKLISIARVSEEKNILGGIEALALTTGGEVVWEIYGTLQDEEYLASCRQAANKIPHLKTAFKGEIEPAQIPALFTQCHFMFLPTLGENYGHAIAESFLTGVPVIISDRTPWNRLEELEAGFDVLLDKQAFADVLNKCIAMNSEAYQRMTAGAISYGKKVVDDPLVVQKNIDLFTF